MGSDIYKGFVNVGKGQVHYRICGEGPPIILLHDSPRSSVLHLPLLKYFSKEFSAIAIDTPGYGNSTPLKEDEQLEIVDFANALSETILGFNLEKCPVYGFHTSSKILLEFAARHPNRVSIAIMDGLSLPDGDTDHDFIANYMRPFKITNSGSYLAEEWTRVRDFQRWFPWFLKSGKTRLLSNQRNMEFMHAYCMDLFMAGPHFSDAYAAAMRYKAAKVVPKVEAKSVFMARQDDVLYPFLDSLPKNLQANCSVERLSSDIEHWKLRLLELFRENSSSNSAKNFIPPNPLSNPLEGNLITKGYVRTKEGQVLIRRCGNGKKIPILFLHDLPGSSRGDEGFIKLLSKDRIVYAIDLPGCNDSDKIKESNPKKYIDSISQVITELNLEKIDLISTGISTSLAIKFSSLYPDKVNKIVLDGIILGNESYRNEISKNYLTDLKPKIDGSHLHACWHMIRDHSIQWPWYDGTKNAIRRIDPELDAMNIHARLVDTLKQWSNAYDPIKASFEINTEEILPKLKQSTLLIYGENDPKYSWVEKASSLINQCKTYNYCADKNALATNILSYLDDS